MKSGRILFTLQRQTETILFAVLFLAFFLLAAVLSGLGYGGFGTMLLTLLPGLVPALFFFLYCLRWRITVYEHSIVFQTLFRKKEYPIAEIRRIVMGTHYTEGSILWLYTQDGKMLSVSSGCKNFERFHRYLQKKRPIEWESAL